MATIKCPECDETINVTHSFCPNCGAKASNIQKAAAGLETLVTLGDAVHKHGPIKIDNININELCRKFKNDCRDRDRWDWVHEVMAGDTNLMMIIGYDYVIGEKYLRKDISQGKKWFRLAMKHGNPDGSRALQQLG